jgi:hypothetical protein
MLNHIPVVPDWVQSVVLPLNRWLHIVATATLVGGALFYEFVIPKAIEELKDETQLAVLGRVRWIFRRIVIFSTVFLVLTGLVESWRTWPSYHGNYDAARPWWVWHVVVGAIAMAIAIKVTLGDRVPRHPIAWMRAAFVVMLVAIFLSGITRHVRLSIEEDAERYGNSGFPSPDTGPSPAWFNSTDSTQPSEPTTATTTTAPSP